MEGYEYNRLIKSLFVPPYRDLNPVGTVVLQAEVRTTAVFQTVDDGAFLFRPDHALRSHTERCSVHVRMEKGTQHNIDISARSTGTYGERNTKTIEHVVETGAQHKRY